MRLSITSGLKMEIPGLIFSNGRPLKATHLIAEVSGLKKTVGLYSAG